MPAAAQTECRRQSAVDFPLNRDIGFGNSYRISLSENFKEYGACIVGAPNGHPTRLGSQSLRFEVKTGDCGWTDGWNDCRQDRARHELSGTAQGDGDYWYHWSLYLPNEFQIIYPAKLALGQFHQKNGHVVWMFQNHTGGYYLDSQLSGRTDYLVKLLSQDQMAGKWNDILVHVKWTHRDDGFFTVWVNGSRVHTHNGATKSQGRRVYQKLGVYQSFLSRYKGASPVPGQTAYFDEIRTADSCAGLGLADLGYDCNALTAR